MKLAQFGRYALSICAAAMLAGCGGSQPPVGATGVMPQGSALAAHAERTGSWMLPEARDIKRLLYISDNTNAVVNIFNYDTSKLVGQLTGFQEPRGQCVDAAGDIWISDFFAEVMIEFARGGTHILKMLGTKYYSPYGCSISPSGDLAVSALGTTTDVMQVWKKARGSPITYATPDVLCDSLSAPGYDENGALYAEANLFFSSQYLVHVCMANPRTQMLEGVEFHSPIRGPDGPMWDGRYMTVMAGGTGGSKVWAAYRVITADRSRRFKQAGKTLFTDSCASFVRVGYPFIVGTQNTPINHTQADEVVGPDAACPGEFDYWHYPAGGAPYKTMNNAPANISGDSVSISP